jgi:hypothetical protein
MGSGQLCAHTCNHTPPSIPSISPFCCDYFLSDLGLTLVVSEYDNDIASKGKQAFQTIGNGSKAGAVCPLTAQVESVEGGTGDGKACDCNSAGIQEVRLDWTS